MKSYILIFILFTLSSCATLTNFISPIKEDKLKQAFILKEGYEDANNNLLAEFKNKVKNQITSKYNIISYTKNGEAIIAKIKYKPKNIKIKIDRRRVRHFSFLGKIKRYSVLESNITNAEKPEDILKVYD